MVRKQKTKKRKFRIKKKKPIYKRRFFWILILTLLFLFSFFYFFFFSPVFQVKEIQIRNNGKVSTEQILGITQPLTETRLIFSTKSIFLISSKKIERAVLANFPQIGSAELKKKLPKTLFLEIKERKPLAIFCRDVEDCFLVDKQGIIFESGREGSDLIVYFYREEDLFLGQQVIEPETLQSIVEVKKGLNEQLKIETERFSFLSDRLSVRTSQGFNIYFRLGSGVADQLFNLDMVLKEKIPPENRGMLEYIDLRFGNKVYYR